MSSSAILPYPFPCVVSKEAWCFGLRLYDEILTAVSVQLVHLSLANLQVFQQVKIHWVQDSNSHPHQSPRVFQPKVWFSPNTKGKVTF